MISSRYLGGTRCVSAIRAELDRRAALLLGEEQQGAQRIAGLLRDHSCDSPSRSVAPRKAVSR